MAAQPGPTSPDRGALSPFVTVLITTFNGMPYLTESVESVLAQSYRDYEVVVVDDGSTDSTAQHLHSIRDPRLRVISLVGNRGRSAALNRGLAAARGVYVAIQDADDLSLPNRLEDQVSIVSRTGSDVVGGQVTVFGDWGQREVKMPVRDSDIRRRFTKGRMGVVNGASLLRKEWVVGRGGFNESIPRVEDLELHLRDLNGTRYGAAEVPVVMVRRARLSPSWGYFLREERWRREVIRRAARNSRGLASTRNPAARALETLSIANRYLVHRARIAVTSSEDRR